MKKSTFLFVFSAIWYTYWILGITESIDVEPWTLFVALSMGWVDLVLGLEAEKKGK